MSKALSDLLNLGAKPKLDTTERRLVDIAIDSIEPNEFQPRVEFDPDALEQLAASIAQLGVLQPILVRTLDNGAGYELIAGERRWRAAQIAGLETIPAIVGTYKDRDSFEQAIVENLHRTDLNPLEESLAYARLAEEFDLTHAEIAERMGKSRPAIVNSIRLLSLPEPVLALIRSRKLSAGHARTIITVGSPELQLELANKAISQNLSVRALENLVRGLAETSSATVGESNKVNFGHLEVTDQLEDYLETKVAIDGSSGRGRIVIEFADTVDLARIYELIIPRSRD